MARVLHLLCARWVKTRSRLGQDRRFVNGRCAAPEGPGGATAAAGGAVARSGVGRRSRVVNYSAGERRPPNLITVQTRTTGPRNGQARSIVYFLRRFYTAIRRELACVCAWHVAERREGARPRAESRVPCACGRWGERTGRVTDVRRVRLLHLLFFAFLFGLRVLAHVATRRSWWGLANNIAARCCRSSRNQ